MPRRRSWVPWLITGAAVVVTAAVVTLLLPKGTADDSDARSTTPSSAKPDTGYDLSSPQAAAESFRKAAKTGSGDTLLSLTCVGRPACAKEHAVVLGGPDLTEAQTTIREGVYELAVHLEKAEFTTPVNGQAPGTKDVPYRTPEMTGDAYLSLTFIQSGGDWLYFSPAA